MHNNSEHESMVFVYTYNNHILNSLKKTSTWQDSRFENFKRYITGMVEKRPFHLKQNDCDMHFIFAAISQVLKRSLELNIYLLLLFLPNEYFPWNSWEVYEQQFTCSNSCSNVAAESAIF